VADRRGAPCRGVRGKHQLAAVGGGGRLPLSRGIESASRPLVDFGELNDKAIKGLMNFSKIVSRFSLYIHEQPLK
jgi:hypothetical protein